MDTNLQNNKQNYRQMIFYIIKIAWNKLSSLYCKCSTDPDFCSTLCDCSFGNVSRAAMTLWIYQFVKGSFLVNRIFRFL